MAETVYVRGTRQDVRRAIYRAAAAASGNGQSSEAATGMQVRLGMTALGLIKRAFIVKSRGETDECGLKWPPLSPKTIAYSRRHPGVLNPGKKRALFAPSWMLTDNQRERWWALYRKGLARFKGDRSAAAKLAWSIVKSEGAETLIGRYGNTKVDILRDTGLLLNSLSPGVEHLTHDITGRELTSVERAAAVENQVFRLGKGEVIVGTNRKWAGTHHKGTARIPQRRLWAEPSQWPQTWWDDIADQGRAGLIDIFLHFLRNP